MIKEFTYCGSCNCNGTRNLKYCKDGVIVYYQPKRKTFHIKRENNYLIKNEPISKLCATLKSLGVTELDECLGIN